MVFLPFTILAVLPNTTRYYFVIICGNIGAGTFEHLRRIDDRDDGPIDGSRIYRHDSG